MRRLNNGTLSPSSICSRLADAPVGTSVVIVPDTRGSFCVASKVRSLLAKRGFNVSVFNGKARTPHSGTHDADNPAYFTERYALEELCDDEPHTAESGLNIQLDAASNTTIRPNVHGVFPAKIFHCVYLGNDSTAKDKELLKRYKCSNNPLLS